MGKKKKHSHSLFSESVDPRFNGIFNSNNDKKTYDYNKNESQHLMNHATESKRLKRSENVGFQDFLNCKLTEFLERHIKEVDRPVPKHDIILKKPESIKLFSDSEAMTVEQIKETASKTPLKKKRKKDRSDKESLKEVVVSFDWLKRQSEILNS